MNKSEDDTIVISLTFPDVDDLPERFIWIQPSDLGWDDFGHVTRAIIGFVRGKSITHEYRAKAAYLDPNRGEFVGVGNAVNDSRAAAGGIRTDSKSVVSLAEEQETYRQIVREMGVEEANVRLCTAGDMVANASISAWRPTQRTASASDVFKFSLTRTSEAFHAYKNAGPILRGLEQEDISAGPEAVVISVKDQDGAHPILTGQAA